MMQNSELDSLISSSNTISESFTTSDFIDKIKETFALAKEIIQHPVAKKNQKIDNLLKIQCCNALKFLTKLNQNDLNPNNQDSDFTRLKFDDQQKISKLVEINDAIVDKTIHYFDCVKNAKQNYSNPNLIQVQMNINTRRNDSKIFIKDYKQENKNNVLLSNEFKRKHSDNESSTKHFRFMAASNVKRPQIVYKINVDNAYSTPFIPKLTKKPNASISLKESLKVFEITWPKNLMDNYEINYPTHSYPHPYQYEIENFTVEPEFFKSIETELKKPKPFEETKFSFVSKRDELYEMVKVLKNYKEIAVDLEHHSFRSYQGLTCLLQISTDDSDYIIDVFPLWNEMEILNEVFTSPSILKVFHSSHFDIIWLQRDFGIYVVNMFDTFIAASKLNYKHLSLSWLVNRFCDIQLDKQFQLADWRIRPLPEEMLQYARSDTHFLLYIYRCLKKELLNISDQTGNFLRTVMSCSQEMCLTRYEKDLPKVNDPIHLVWKNNLRFNFKQTSALKSLYFWRDTIARREDESTRYVLPNNLLLKICEILPREPQGILACCNPIPPLVRQYINEIHRMILDARILMDQHSDIKVVNQEKSDMTIDLTNDLMMDHYHPNKTLKINDDDHHINQHGLNEQEDTPLFQWSMESNKFIINEHSTILSSSEQNKKLSWIDMPMEIDKDHHSMIDMFNNSLEKMDSNMETQFSDYITFYQRYLIKMKQKEEKSKT